MTDQITQLLDDVQRLDEQATKAPWIIDSIESGEHALFVDEDNPGYGHLGAASSTVASFLLAKNADFIANARESLPKLAKALRDIMEIHKPFHADHYYNGMDGESLHRFVLRCDGCEESGGIEDYPCPTVQAITDALEATSVV